ncbi:ATP-binding cassette domain-containing protein [Helicobacter pametensis]|uniref:ATP-binding cassette domain-containing protein n=1 Tax=Helicobacter pametensis TaxID=95149 RepID=UPI000482AE87|nr:ATP-binding cassette domain-containing protein [Helicobacter pametensis]
MLRVENLCFSYEKRSGFGLSKISTPILDHLSFSLQSGENMMIYGSSGSGKSTLGKILAGLISAQAGEIWLDDERIVGLSPLKIQYIFQDQKTALNPHKNVRQLILSVAWALEEKVDLLQLLDLYGLDEKILDLRVSALSSGEAQRIGILRALIAKPKILICDEVFASLDLGVLEKILSILRSYQKEHSASFIFISHIKEALGGMYQKILRLD